MRRRLHVVDLDGATRGEPVNIDIISQIASVMMIPTQIGGGIRSIEDMEKLFRIGIDYVILGTATVEEPKLVEQACRPFGSSLIVSLDARDGFSYPRLDQETVLDIVEFARQLVAMGVKRFIYTDISRGSTLTEPNFTGIFDLVEEIGLPVIAAGGISSLSHLKILKISGGGGGDRRQGFIQRQYQSEKSPGRGCSITFLHPL